MLDVATSIPILALMASVKPLSDQLPRHDEALNRLSRQMNRIAGWITDYGSKFQNTVDRSPRDVAPSCAVSG